MTMRRLLLLALVGMGLSKMYFGSFVPPKLIPQFSDAMEVWGLEYEENPRATTRRMEVWGGEGMPESGLDRIRAIVLVRQSQEQTIPLDPQVFGPGFRDESSRYFRDWDWFSN